MLEKININTATTRELTQLSGIAKNLAYRIVNHRDRHGFFTHWEELAEVKEFPMNNLDRIKQDATPRRVKPAHLQREKKKPKGYTKSIRSTRRQDRMKAP
jgi:competence ComEA-like helix-hairpin-helix protein